MKNDLILITKTYPRSWKTMHLYALGDVHVGAENFDEETIKKKIQIIKDDPVGVVSICGDLGDFGLKNSKTNVYRATMSPDAQIDYIYELFLPIKDKIVSLVPGNHEERILRETSISVLYDLAVLWRIPEVYRENVAILKLSFGKYKGGPTQNTFVGITSHGTSRNKHHHFVASFDGIDFAISGHCHQPSYTPHGKIRVNNQQESAYLACYKEIVVDANLTPGGYSLKKEYEVAPPPELQYLELTTKRNQKKGENTLTKVINYHSIQI